MLIPILLMGMGLGSQFVSRLTSMDLDFNEFLLTCGVGRDSRKRFSHSSGGTKIIRCKDMFYFINYFFYYTQQNTCDQGFTLETDFMIYQLYKAIVIFLICSFLLSLIYNFRFAYFLAHSTKSFKSSSSADASNEIPASGLASLNT